MLINSYRLMIPRAGDSAPYPSSEIEHNDLYKVINPPIPLIPKNKYTDDLPRSYFLMLYEKIRTLKRLLGIEYEYMTGEESRRSCTLGPEISFFSLCEGKNSNVVYKRDPNSPPYNSNLLDLRKFLQGNAKPENKDPVQPFYTPGTDDKTLVFESRFESGNLSLAIKASDTEYNLVLQNDINSKGNTQWFYFQMKNTTEGLNVKFNIVNFTKKDSLYNFGMKILVFSEKENEKSQLGWFREGTEISYYQNNIRRPGSSKCFFSLSFNYQFAFTGDTVYFAYCFPYTYSDLIQDIIDLEQDPFVSTIMSRKKICDTIGGNNCYCLSITAPCDPDRLKKKKGVVLTGRVHPGETVGSWMMKGAIEFLTSNTKEAEILREAYVFKVIPMLNPDGVIYGNYRCGLAGVDLNRRWKNPNKNLHPTIFHAKKYIKSLAKERTIELVCDMHGHSRQKSIFAYGCSVPESPETTRVYPYILSKVSPFFSYSYCSFKMQKAKESTLRISLFKELGCSLIYTLEASFCGTDFVKHIQGKYAGLHFTTQNLMDMGKQVCLALIVNGDLDKRPTDSDEPTENPTFTFFRRADVMQELLSNQELLKDNDNDCSSGSESDPSEDNLDPEEITSVYPVTLTPKPKPVEKKKSLSPSKARAESNRSLTSQKERTKIIAKCKICGEPEIAGHVCVKPKPKPQLKPLTKPQSSITLVSQPYYNAAGKKVRDQATQTVQLSQTPGAKSVEEQKGSTNEGRNTSISPTKKEIRPPYRASSSEDPGMLARMWKQEKAFPNFTRGARQSSAWKYNDSIRK